jgi:hypothetical protein
LGLGRIGLELNFTVLMLKEYIRMKVLKVGKGDAFFIKINNQLKKTTDSIGLLHQQYADPDGFLYIQLKKESIF